MHLIKLNAIDSTNDFLKALALEDSTENFTVVTAEEQTRGKGQMGSKWFSEPGKNLIMSMLIKDTLQNIDEIYLLNIAFALAITDVLISYKIPKLSIKWPNDIMSDSKKTGGILIENAIKADGGISSVAGLGLNINQRNFDGLPQASSLALIMNSEFDKQLILTQIVKQLKAYIQKLIAGQTEQLWKIYNQRLFKKGLPVAFENQDGLQFMGIIQGVSREGKLQVLKEDETIQDYGIKEIRMLF